MRVRHLLTGSRLTVLLAVSLQTAVLTKRAHADPPSLFGVGGSLSGSPSAVTPVQPSRAVGARPAIGSGTAPGTVTVRSGNHPGYGRFAFDLSGPMDVAVERAEDAIILHFGNAVPPGLAGLMLPRNVHAVQSDAHDVTISINSGAQVRSDKTSRQLVLDILDPPAAVKEQSQVLARPVLAARVRPATDALADSSPRAFSATPVHSAPAGPLTGELPKAADQITQQSLPNTLNQANAVTVSEQNVAKTHTTDEAERSEEAGPVATDFAAGSRGSDLGASEPPTAAALSNLAPNVSPPHLPKPIAVSTGRPSAAPSAPVASIPPAGLSNAVARPSAPPLTAPTSTSQSGTQVAENPPISLPPPRVPASSQMPAQPLAPAAVPVPASPAPLFPPPPFGAESENTNAPNWAIPPVNNATQPVQTTAALIPVAEQSRGAAIALPFAPTTGAAALRRGDDAVVVFDENRAIDLSALQNHPVFGSAGIQLLEGATILRLKLPPNSDLRLAKVPSGWSLWVGPVGDVSDTGLQTLGSSVTDSRMEFAASLPSKTVVVPDPETGGNLLVGTQHQSGEAVPLPRRTPDFVVLPTLQGVIIEPSSDRPQLQVASPGFVLSGVDRPLALSNDSTLGTAAADAATLSRRFNLQALPLLLLRQSLKNRIDEAAATPPLARLAKRRAVAEAYLALGMGAEAQAMMRLAVMDDPRASEDPDSIALGAMGAILAERTDQAQAIDDPRITGTDEIRLWRAIRKAQLQEGSKSASVDFADTDRLVLAYPDLLRDHLLPLVVETEALGGQVTRAAAVIAKRPDDPGLLLARAFVLRAQGDTKGALAVFDKLTMGHDRLLRFRSAIAALQLRVSTKAMTASDAADAGEKLLYGWRGDDRERDLRFQIAAWRFQAGQWSGALAMLRESAATFPDLRAQYRRQITETLRGLMRDDRLSQMDPIQLISLLEDNKELLPDGPEGQLAATELADRMAQLDLGQRSEPILARLAKTTPSLPARAAFGLRLAALRLNAGDPAGAMAALSDSASDDGLGPELTERRALLAARASAASGQVAPAVAALVAIGTPSADLVRATIEETAKDWSGASNALVSYVSRTVPSDGKLNAEQSHVIVRLAAAMAQGGDEAGLAGLRQQYALRMQDSVEASTFKLLTEAPVRDVTDLPRSAKELAAARTVAAPARQ